MDGVQSVLSAESLHVSGGSQDIKIRPETNKTKTKSKKET